MPNDGVRDLPDVSLFAANGIWGHYYIYCNSDTGNGGAACKGAPSTWSAGGGTSFAAPIMAGMQALVNQKTGARQGNPNPTYYKLAAAEYGSANSACIFYDVTQGDIDVNCTGTHNCYRPSGTNGVLSTSTTAYKPAYGAGSGFDYATGIGTVNAYNLVNSWSSVTTAKSKFTGMPASGRQ
jgi:subtilase family serine protease